MTLASGQSLSFYEILGPLGAGGMGEVYRARDTRLEREVAIKVLPEHLAEDGDRLRRFEREAKTLATLHHPNIASIFGIDQVGDTCFIAMELVEGQDLGERLSRGPLPVEEAVEVCRQIAEGLETAHEAGVVHRDLKPANVRLTPQGGVKILDFGLAKPMRETGSGSSATAKPDSFLVTEEGMVLGTPTYMSPEQARGKPVDRRTDVWAFGCVLYECLTGQRAFGGEAVADVLGAIVGQEPDWSRLPVGTPPRVVELLHRCFEKDPRRRLRDVGEARVLLETGGGAPAVVETRSAARPGSPSRLAAGVLLGLLAGLAAGYLVWRSPAAPSTGSPAVTRSVLTPPEGTTFQMFGDFAGPPVLSPDGRKLAFVGNSRDGQNRVWIRALDDLEAHPVRGTEGAYQPFWSPDGQSIGFFADDALRRVDLDGGSPLRLCGVTQGKGGSWAPDGTIVFGPNFASSLYRVSAAGGEARPATELEPGQTTHRWPSFLRDGKQFLYFAASHDDLQAPKGIFVATVGENDGELLVESDANGVFCAGYLLYVHGGVLVAQRFDPETRALTGEPRLLGERVRVDTSTWRANFGASSGGVLVYQTLGGDGGSRLLWVDRTGAEVGSIPTQGEHLSIDLSPSGRYLAAETQVSPNSDIWVHDLERSVQTRLTFEPSDEGQAAWSPDETRIAFQSNRGDGRYRLYEKLASGASRARMIYEKRGETGDKLDIWPADWSPDGRWLLVVEGTYGDYERGRSLSVLDLEDEDAVPWGLVESESAITGQFSPDGRWLAYSAIEDGLEEVYVAPFDAGDLEGARPGPLLAGAPRWQISRSGGSRPRWRGDGKELYYVRHDNTLVAVQVETEGRSVHVGEPSDLFTAPIRFRDYSYDVTNDGQRFILNTPGFATTTPLVLVSDWRAGLAAR